MLIFVEPAVDHIGQASFQGAAGLGRGLVLGEFAQVVDPSGARVAGLADGDGVQGGVELAIAAGVEPVPDALAAGGVQRCGAAVAGEVTAGGESGDVADDAEDLCGGNDAQAVDVGQAAAGGGQG